MKYLSLIGLFLISKIVYPDELNIIIEPDSTVIDENFLDIESESEVFSNKMVIAGVSAGSLGSTILSIGCNLVTPSWAETIHTIKVTKQVRVLADYKYLQV
ncbi:hypothetical protein N473_20915 [Pseudoalteromonas luteoviolacea CPMOR-1]|uniref:Uncharacterized protein n=1 Tax=Pseudoalteromonas luteoviolacea CPMOR-1 TaxID=1365248 RepID=A0A162C4K9_9GAMM|nr:hypothetical protein [Pseudoalteromonas luteoviolacea]KZN62007.1 hypothetical protein N473_20915 [Pseudoalteromonas luteoviolacea CPMOR-1]